MAAQRKELAEAYINISKEPAGVQVFDANGKEVPAQLLNWENGKAHIAFSASVAPLSCSVYDVRFGKNNKGSFLKATQNSLENSIYKLTLDTNGDIVSIVDKRSNKELVEQGKAFRLALLIGNESKEWPAWEIQKKTINKPGTPISENVRISIEEQGPCYAALRIERTFKSSKFVQYIRMSEGANDERIDIINEIDWSTKDAVLKAEFPMNVKNQEAVYDLGIGTVKRKNNTDIAYEVYAQQWADITSPDKSYGISILNDCKYGWDKPNDNTLRLTLLHAPSTKDRYKYQEQQDFGHHTFTYSIVGHQNEALQAGISHLAESLNSHLAVFNTPKHKGALGREYSFVKVNTPQVAIRSLKKAEESDRLKMAFLANMSHEIRTPLNAIVGFSDVIASTYNELSDEERADFVRLISINSEHLVRLIDDILDLSKIESNTIKFTYSCCSLKSMMKDIEKEQAVKQLPEIEIKALLPDDDIYINTDATRLKQVICNFINNARKFTEKGYIHFGFTSHSEKDQLVYLFVEDTGEGIPQECQKEIFDRFYKVNTFKQGTGLGLSICKTIVEHLQGSISVESEIGKGSRFIVTLPFKRQSKGV